MTYQERTILAQLLRNIAVFAVFSWIVWRMDQQDQFAGPHGAVLIGKAILWMIAAQIVAAILTEILAKILAAMFGDADGLGILDERDRQAENQGLKMHSLFFGIGFALSMLALVWGWPIPQVFYFICLAATLGESMSNLTKLWLYRRGF